LIGGRALKCHDDALQSQASSRHGKSTNLSRCILIFAQFIDKRAFQGHLAQYSSGKKIVMNMNCRRHNHKTYIYVPSSIYYIIFTTLRKLWAGLLTTVLSVLSKQVF
jgi:hypothetical protein